MSSTQEKLPPEHNCHWRAYGQPDGTVVCDECNCAADVNKLIDSAKREAIGNHPIVALLRELDDTLPKGKYSTITIKYMPGGKAQLEQSEESI